MSAPEVPVRRVKPGAPTREAWEWAEQNPGCAPVVVVSREELLRRAKEAK